KRRLVGAPTGGVRSRDDPIDRLAVDPEPEREPHVLPPLVRGAAANGRPQDHQLALARRQRAAGQQVAAKRQPDPEQVLVPGQGAEDVVRAERPIGALGDEGEDLGDALLPLAARERGDPRRDAHARGALVRPPSTTRLWPVTYDASS